MAEKQKITIGVETADGAAGAAPPVDARKIVDELLAEVARKRAAGAYEDPRIARAEHANILLMKDGDDFVERYLDCLCDLVQVDINDFDIRERRSGAAAKPLLFIKRALWKLLKFYTYRMWSQQNQTNELLLSALDVVASRQRQEIAALKARVEALEKNSAQKG
jgi:hypothetical protein